MKVDNVVLRTLKQGDTLVVTAGHDPEAYTYNLAVIEPGERPACTLSQTSPDGTVVGPNRVVLEGSGHWTTHDQNPAQDFWPERQMSIGFGVVRVGGFLIVSNAETGKLPRGRFQLMPECTEIEVASAVATV